MTQPKIDPFCLHLFGKSEGFDYYFGHLAWAVRLSNVKSLQFSWINFWFGGKIDLF